MLVEAAYALAGLIGLGIILIGGRFLLQPARAAADFGIPGYAAPATGLHAWLAVKGARDIASGLFIFILLSNEQPHLMGRFMLAASLIAVSDAVIVLRSGGSRAAAYGIHGVTALVMLAISALLITA